MKRFLKLVWLKLEGYKTYTAAGVIALLQVSEILGIKITSEQAEDFVSLFFALVIAALRALAKTKEQQPDRPEGTR